MYIKSLPLKRFLILQFALILLVFGVGCDVNKTSKTAKPDKVVIISLDGLADWQLDILLER